MIGGDFVIGFEIYFILGNVSSISNCIFFLNNSFHLFAGRIDSEAKPHAGSGEAIPGELEV